MSKKTLSRILTLLLIPVGLAAVGTWQLKVYSIKLDAATQVATTEFKSSHPAYEQLIANIKANPKDLAIFELTGADRAMFRELLEAQESKQREVPIPWTLEQFYKLTQDSTATDE